jgi:hypothetical protein
MDTGSLSPRNRWLLVSLVLVVAVVAPVWYLMDDGPARPRPRRQAEPEVTNPPPPESAPTASETREFPPDLVVDVAAPNPAPIPQPPPPPQELLALPDIRELRIELPVNLHLAGHTIVGATGPDKSANAIPSMLGDYLARGGWEDLGFEIAFGGLDTLYVPANNRYTSLEAVLRRESMTGSQWRALVEWAHGQQEQASGASDTETSDPCPISVVPRLRSAPDRQSNGTDDHRRLRVADEQDALADPPPPHPASPTFVGLVRLPTTVDTAKVELQRPGRKPPEATGEPPRPLLRRLLLRLATHDLDLASLNAPGMAVGFGRLAHPAIDGPLPMVNPRVMCNGSWGDRDPAMTESPPQRSEFVQHLDRFFWFMWEDVRRITTVTHRQLAETGAWRLWTLKDALNEESEFLAIGLGTAQLADLALDFGTVDAPGTLLRVSIARDPAPLPLELAELPVGVHLDILIAGPKREKRLPEPAQIRRHSYEPLPLLESRALSHFLHAFPVKPADWEHVVFIPGQHTRIHGSAFAPAHTGVRWMETSVEPVPDGETVLALPQAWQGSITATATWSGAPLPDASYVVMEVWQSPQESGVYFPGKFGKTVRAPADRHQWRLGSSLFGGRFQYPYAPTLADWEYMFGTGRLWVGVHQVRVAEELRTNFVGHATTLHHGLQVPEEAVHLMWREGGPRLEESELANVGKNMPRQPSATPPMLTVYTVPEDAYEAARELTMWPPHYKLPSPIREKPKGTYPIGTNKCLRNGTWVFAAHRDYGFGFVFIPIGTTVDVEFELAPWSAIGWDWKHIPRGHWPDGTPASYKPPSQADPKAPATSNPGE